MNKIFLTTALVCSASAFAYAHHSNIADDMVNKFHHSQPTVNLNHYDDTMVAVLRCPRYTARLCSDWNRTCSVSYCSYESFKNCQKIAKGKWAHQNHRDRCQ